MKDIKDNFIPYEEAKQLKELGFNEPCFKFYYNDGELSDNYPTTEMLNYINCNFSDSSLSNKHLFLCSSPLWQQAWEFFREKGIQSFFDFEYNDGFLYYFKWCNKYGEWDVSPRYTTHEEAQLECLRTLIKLVQK